MPDDSFLSAIAVKIDASVAQFSKFVVHDLVIAGTIYSDQRAIPCLEFIIFSIYCNEIALDRISG